MEELAHSVLADDEYPPVGTDGQRKLSPVTLARGRRSGSRRSAVRFRTTSTTDDAYERD